MNQFIHNYPVLSVVGFILIILCITAIAYILRLVYNERLRAKVKKQSKRILSLLADISELEQRNEYLSVKGINQGIDIEILKDQLKSAQLGAKVMPYVEGMTTDFLSVIRDNERFKELFNLKNEELKEVKHAFTQASNELNNLQKAEKENVDLKAMYRKCVEENEQLKERAKRLQETIEHKRHSKKEQKETGWYTPKNDVFDWFKVGEVYEQCQRTDGTFSLYRYIDGKKRNYVVDKSWFTPAPVPIICVKEHQKGIASDKN